MLFQQMVGFDDDDRGRGFETDLPLIPMIVSPTWMSLPTP